MRDFARSDHVGVQKQLDRLGALSVPHGRLGLETIRMLLERLGNPHHRLPPTFHVAGTNGKGSTSAFLRAILEADGYKVHVTTSPHLVRYNERIRVAGRLIEDERLAKLLAEVLDAGKDLSPSFFEVTIAAAFTEFARVPADACVVEVGLGGRFDATNVLGFEVLAACGIAALGIDHERFLLAPEEGVPEEPMARIAFEKAGIAKPGVPLVVMPNTEPEIGAIREVAAAAGAKLSVRGKDWDCAPTDSRFYFYDYPLDGAPEVLDRPAIPGEHQILNASLAIAMLRAQNKLTITGASVRAGLRNARWPARLQKLQSGPLTVLAGEDRVWLDGGHNLSAGEAIADWFDFDFHLVIGMLANKDPNALIKPLGERIRSITMVPVPGHEYHSVANFGPDAVAASDIENALLGLPDDGVPILIAGSLYLAGEVLRLNDEVPD